MNFINNLVAYLTLYSTTIPQVSSDLNIAFQFGRVLYAKKSADSGIWGFFFLTRIISALGRLWRGLEVLLQYSLSPLSHGHIIPARKWQMR